MNLHPPEPRSPRILLHEEPLIFVQDDFATGDEIRHLQQAGKDRLKPAATITDDGTVTTTGRSGSVCWVPQHHDPVIAALAQRLSALVGLPLSHSEPFQLVHYAATQGYAPHYDGWQADTEAGRRCMARSGQRLVTCLLYLNDVPGSGGTAFVRLKFGVDARRGRLLVFHNCHKGSNLLHPDTLHAGMPVRSGEKWVCNLWFREREFHAAG